MTNANFSSWWGRHSIDYNRTDLWQIGPLKLWISQKPKQWVLNWKHSSNWLDSDVRLIPGSGGENPPEDSFAAHCASTSTNREDVVFSPALPDRPLISKLQTPLEVLPNESVQLYIVFPLWLRIELANPAKVLQEIPTFRLSDTWFGPMLASGEICYASKTSAFLDLSEVPLRLHCAVSSVTVHNMSLESLRLERLQVPLPRLSLFFSPRTGFWTNSVAFEHRGDENEMVRLRLDRQPPPEVAPSQFVTGPRVPESEGIPMVRAFSALLRERSQG